MPPNRHHIINSITSIIVILSCAIVLIISFTIKAHITESPTNTDESPEGPSLQEITSKLPIVNPGDLITKNPEPEPPATPTFIDLQPTLNTWLKTLTTSEKAGVLIYDINNQRVAASFQADQVFEVASIYKLLFAYDGYMQLTTGANDPNQVIVTTTEKGPLTLSTCLDLILRESYNGCADVLNRDRARINRVYSLIDQLNMTNTRNIGLSTTATDLTHLLLKIWQHDDLSSDYWNQLSDSMLNQPPSRGVDGKIYDWRQGLPAGFSNQVKVYNKVGWSWNGKTWDIYADAAILDFINLNRQYTAVVLTRNLSNYSKITNLGRMIESAVESRE